MTSSPYHIHDVVAAQKIVDHITLSTIIVCKRCAGGKALNGLIFESINC